MKGILKWGAIGLVALIVLAKMFGGGAKDAAPATAPDASAPAAAPAEPTEAPAGLTLAQFEAIQTGATYEEVVAAIGEPKATMSESEIMGTKSAVYQWAGAGFASNAMLTFSDNKLMSKAQVGLK